jgi:PiT family inorganic phosphate transporter
MRNNFEINKMDIWIIFVIILSLLMSFSIGSNDAANGLATSYGSKALSLKKLVVIGSISEFIGAMFCANKVAATLSEDIIPTLSLINQSEERVMMFSTCLASFVFIMSSSIFGMPISGTHTVVGALLGTGIIVVGPYNLSWIKMGHIALSWIISPLLACALSCGLMLTVCSLTLNTKTL